MPFWSTKKTKVKDPVCGMEVDSKGARARSEYQSQLYYFCSQFCKDSFDKEPGKYVKEGPKPMGGMPMGHH